MKESTLSILEEVQVFSKQDWLERVYRKSESQSSRDAAETALNVFGSFCIYLKKTEQELINEYQVLEKAGEIRRLCLSLDRLVQFMNTDHPEIKHSNPLMPERKVGFKRKSPKTIKSYFAFIKAYLRICYGIRIANEDIKDFVQFPKPMNKTIAITSIVLVAVVMGMSAVAPMIPQAEAIPTQACPGIIKATQQLAAAGKPIPPNLRALVTHCEAFHQ